MQQAAAILAAETSSSSSTTAQAQVQTQIRTVNARALTTENALVATRKVLIKSLVEAFDLREAAPSESPYRRSSSTQKMSSSSYIAGAGMALFGRGSMLVQSTADTSGKLGTVVAKSEWSIAGLVMPVPGDLRSMSQTGYTKRKLDSLSHHRILSRACHGRCSTYAPLHAADDILPWCQAAV